MSAESWLFLFQAIAAAGALAAFFGIDAHIIYEGLSRWLLSNKLTITAPRASASTTMPGKLVAALLALSFVLGGAGFVLSLKDRTSDQSSSWATHSIGPSSTFRITDSLQAGLSDIRVDGGWNIVLTGPDDSSHIQGQIRTILMHEGNSNISFRDLPDYQKRIDAPHFPQTGSKGIILHGRNALNDTLFNILSQCFSVKQADSTVDWLAREYGMPHPVWIEIGQGSPWKGPQTCSD